MNGVSLGGVQLLCALDSSYALSLGSQCAALCVSPSLVEVTFKKPPREVHSVELYVNGNLKKTTVYLKVETLSVISPEQLKPNDQVFIKIYDGLDYEGNPINIPLSRVYGSFINDGSLRAFFGPNRINPLSTTPTYRGVLVENTVTHSGLIYDWIPPPTIFPSSGQLTTLDPQYVRVFLDNKDSSLSRTIFWDTTAGRNGEELTLTVQFRAQPNVAASIGIHVTDMMGNVYSDYAEAPGVGTWQTLSLAYKLGATGTVVISLYAAEASDHTKNLNNTTCEVHFKNVSVASAWRQAIFNDPMIFPNAWESSGIAVPGRDQTGNLGFASWLDIFPNGVNNSLALLTNNTLSFAVSKTTPQRPPTVINLQPTSITLMAFNSQIYTYVDPVKIKLVSSEIAINLVPEDSTFQSSAPSIITLLDPSEITLMSL